MPLLIIVLHGVECSLRISLSAQQLGTLNELARQLRIFLQVMYMLVVRTQQVSFINHAFNPTSFCSFYFCVHLYHFPNRVQF